MRYIPLTQGKYAIVDDEDYDRVAKYKWHVHARSDTLFYAMHVSYEDGRKRIYMHRFILGVDNVVDHKNGNGLDNRKENLRPCTDTENKRNRKIQKNNTSGYKGVWIHRAGTYRAMIKWQGKNRHLGMFDNPKDAARAYNAAAIKLYGEFARLNTV